MSTNRRWPKEKQSVGENLPRPFGRRELLQRILRQLAEDLLPRVGSTIDSTFFGNALYIRPSNGVVVKISIHSPNGNERWSGVLLNVFSRQSVIDTTFADFDSNVQVKQGVHVEMSASLHTEDWVGEAPTSITPLLTGISGFVKFWAKQEN